MNQKIEAFLTVLRESQLLEPAQVEELGQTAEAQAADLNGLAKVILQKGWLSRFQLTLIGQGKTKELMLGPYRLLDRLGEGGMGMVYKAFHQPMSRTVALKVIRKEKLASQQATQRFFREVQAAAKLVHPNIVVAFDANQLNGTHYFAMEYVDGIDLARLVKQNGPLPVLVACDYIRQAALGLQHAHEQGMVHRDIKPHNLLVSQAQDNAGSKSGSASSSKLGHKAVVKILDMGLARLSTAPADHGLTQDGAVIGTPEYIPPEQARDSRAADIRADLYSLGCTFFFLLTGRPPFQAGTLAEILLKHQMDPAPDVRKLRAEVPEDVAAIVAQLLAKKPEERFQTPQDLANALEPICKGGTNPYVLPQRGVDNGNVFSDLHGSDEGSSDSLASKTQAESPPSTRRLAARAKQAPPRGPNKALIAGLAGAAVVLIALVIVLVIFKRGGANPDQHAGNTGTDPGTVTPTGTEPPAVADFNLKLPFLLTMNAGEQKLLRVDVERLRGNQAISVTLSGLPTGVFAQPATITPEKTFVDVLLMAAPNSTIKDTEVEVVADNGRNKVAQKFHLALKPASGSPTPPIVVSKSEQEIRQFPWPSPALLNNVAYGLDDSHFFTAGYDNQLRRWHLQTGFEAAVPQAPQAGGRALALTADGRQAFVGYADGSARLWDLVSGKLLQTVHRLHGLETVALSGDGRYGLTAGSRNTAPPGQPVANTDFVAIAWDLQTGKELARYDKHPNPIRSAAISPDGKFALTHATGGTGTLWELTTGKFIRNNTRIGSGTTRIVYAPDGKHFFTTHMDRNARMWNADTLDLVREFRGHEAGLLALAVSPDGKRILTGGGSTRLQDGQTLPVDCAIRLWDVESGREIQQFPGHAKPVVSVAFAPDGKTALSSAHDQTIRLWDLSKAAAPPVAVAGAEVRSIPCAFVPTNLFYLPASKHVLTANSDTRLRTWDIENSKELQVMTGAMGIRTSAVSADGRRAFTVFGDGSAVLWDTDTGQEVKRFQIPTPVSTACLSPDARYAMTGGGRIVEENGQKVQKDYEARTWDLETGKEICRYEGHRSWVGRSAISPDGRRILMATAGGGLHLWELTTGKGIKYQEGVLGVNKIHFAPDGRHVFLAIGTQVHMWDAEGLQNLRIVARHETGISHIAVSADSRYLLTGSGGPNPADCTVRLWEIETGKELKRFEGHTRGVTAVAFTDDGRFALSSSGDQTIRQWDLGQQPAVAVKPPPPTPVQRREPPDADTQAAKRKEIRDTFKSDYAKTKQPERRELAGKLLDTASSTKDDIAGRFMLLQEAADVAAACGFADGAMKALDQMANEFTVDGTDLKLKALTTASKAALLAPDQKAIADAALAIAEESLDEEKYDLALKLVGVAETAARRINNVPLITRSTDRARDLREMQKEAEVSKAAQTTLKEKPDDPEANLTVGKFLALRKGDWDAGLPYLIKGTDTALQAVAKKDLTNPSQAAGQIEVGDAWWDHAATVTGPLKAKFQQRAGHWYQQAAPSLNGLPLERVEGRLKQITGLESLPPVEVTAVKLTGHTDKIYSLAVSPDGKFALTGSADRTVKVWDIGAGNQWHSFGGFLADVRGVAWSSDGRLALAGTAEGGVRLLEPELRRSRNGYGFLGNMWQCVALHDDLHAWMGNNRGRITFWGINPEQRGNGFGSTKLAAINSIAISSDGRFGLCGSDDGIAHVWDLESGREQGVLLHGSPVLGVAVTKDFKQAVTGSADKLARLWDLNTGRPLKVFKGHQAKVTCVAITPDGRYLVSGSEDRTVRLWDPRSGKELRRFPGHEDLVTGVGITPDGRYIVSSSADKIVRLWDLKPTKP